MKLGNLDSNTVHVDRPHDFEEFWHTTLNEAIAIPLQPQLAPVPMRSTNEVDVYDIRYNSLDGLEIAGWYCRPRPEYIKPPYPALLCMPGYMAEPELPKSWACKGYAALGVAPRGKLRSNRRFDPGFPGLLTHNVTNRDTYAYRGLYIDALRAVDFALSRPEIDSSRIGIRGGSQGGALAIATAALRPEAIACGAVSAPFLAGIVSALDLTHSYPYEELNEYLRMHPDRKGAITSTLSYYDVISFAPLVRAPLLVGLGLMDDCCPPETGLALLDALQNCSKIVHTYPRCAHDAGAHWEAARVETFLASHLRPLTA